jgi:DNA polymerase-1
MPARIVPPIGPVDHPLLALVGEAPGQKEELEGKPFVGNAGFLLDQMLAAVGISRHECFITNVANTRPPRNDFSVYYSDSKRTKPTLELLDHRKRLKQELYRVMPRVVVALGEEALKATANVVGITSFRGCIIECTIQCHPARVMPTYHPAYILRMYSDRPVVELDLKKAMRQARTPFKPQMKFQLEPSYAEVMEFFEQQRSPVAVDIESIGPCTRSIGFAWSDTEAINIPLIWQGSHCWPSEKEGMILQSLNNYLGDRRIQKYLQNGPYDTTIIANELGIHVDGIVLDTMYAQHLLYPELPKGLDFQSSVYTDFPKYWGHKDQGQDRPNAKYNCYDCCATFIAAQRQLEELCERDLIGFYNDRVHPTIWALTRMQNRGIKVDEESRAKVKVETQAKLDKAEATLLELVGHEVNPYSPKQVKELVYDEWKLPVQRKPKTKTVTTDDDALRSLARKFPQYGAPLRTILTCRQTRKLISTYIDCRLDSGRARTSYGLTKTGRISSSATWDGYGGNLQNIPRGDFRRLYVADEGKVLIKADLSQAEYMVFCWHAPVPEYIHEYTTNPNFDVHRLHASRIFDLAEEAVTKESRYNAKQGVYAGNYGIGPLKLSRMHDMDFRLAKDIIEGYKRIRPELELWWRRIEDEIKTTRTLTNPLGRERIFLGRIDSALFRAAYDWICQSTVADLINQALVTLDEAGYECLLQVHDELVVQVENDPLAIAQGVKDVRNAMEIPVKFPNIDVPMVIPAEIAVGPNWYDVKEYGDG